MSTPTLDAPARRLRWPWVALGLGLLWTVLIRVPLVLNAHDHLDSDLSVDGLTLLDAVHGHWRWHYPGTPYMGILPMLTSYPQALVWGADPITLVSGGTIIWLLVVGSTFWLTARAYGLEVAGWAILPLVCSSLGTIWLSGRITGGHLLTLVWHTGAFAGFYVCLTRGRWPRAAALGLWCGLGLYLDAMFLFTLAGMVPAALLAWLTTGRSKNGIGLAAMFSVAMLVGLLPREIGRRVDPYDAYPSQFDMTLKPEAIWEHIRLLGFHCLPRLIAGTELHQLENAGTSIQALMGIGPVSMSGAQIRSALPGKGEWLAVLLVMVFLMALVRLARDAASATQPARRAISLGTFYSALLITAAFLVNRNIYNSDNYRYLIFLLTPWALGFGLVLSDLARRGWAGWLSAWLVAALLFEVMTSATFLWYRDERVYVDQRGMPVRLPLPDWSELTVVPDVRRGTPAVTTNFVVPPDVSHVMGGYWDVYKIAFLSGGRLVGVPFSLYPNRFRGWSRGLGPGRGKLLILNPETNARNGALAASAERGTGTVRSAKRTNWQSGLRIMWVSDGRDPAELSRLQAVVP
jgi:hypothetical protein